MLTRIRSSAAHAAPRPRLARLAAVGATLAALTGGLLMSSAPTANATGVCGSSYRLIDTYGIKDDGRTRGYIYLYYSASSGKNCAVAKPVSWWAGDVRGIVIGMTDRGGGYDWDPSGTGGSPYRYYAGPVYVHAPNECVSLAAWFYGPDGRRYSRSTGWVHCG